MAESAITAVARGVGNLAVQEACFLCGVHDEVEFLREDLRSLQTVLTTQAEAQRGSGADALAADSVHRIRGAAYEAENIVDAADYMKKRNSRYKGLMGAMTRYARKPSDLVARHRLGKDILRVRRRLQDAKSIREIRDAIDAGGHVIARGQELCAQHRASLPRAAATGDDSGVVGFERDLECIVEWLKDSGTLQLTVISIVAMGGAGKTTLARKAYSSAAVKEHFEAFAFVPISQQFELLHVLKEITAQAMGIKRDGRGFDRIGLPGRVEELEKMGEQELAEMLHKFLQGKRYLIVLDDVWKMDTWEVIQHAFPDLGNGSRVMLTTRNLQVAKQANKLTHVHKVRLLNEQESWQLFLLKAFPSYESIDANNRLELENIGKNLVKKCNGLPLALIVLGSHLSKNLHLDTWMKMDRCLDWEVTSKWGNMQRIIARSYDDMPYHYLKSCFLYMACFPEDFIIDAHNLTRLWIAEGFVPHRTNQTLEETALDCLEELAQRSMVHILSRGERHGFISSVQMHDVLRKWAVQQARKEGFLKLCKNHGEVSNGMLAYRLSFLGFFDDQICKSVTNMRSMLGFSLSSVAFRSPRFLRTLNIHDSNLEKVSKVIGRLIHLRYIGLISCKNVVLTSSIGQLLNLQTITLDGTSIPYVPKSLWDIPTLRHVEITDVETFTPTTIRADEQSNLQTLHVGGWGGEHSQLRTHSTGWIRLRRYLMRIAQLRSMYLGSNIILPVDVLACLSNHRHLDFLDLDVWESMTTFPDSSQLPQNLRCLYLRFYGTWYTWHADLLPTLGRLQSLVHLGLWVQHQRDDAEDGSPIMSSPAGGFPRLRSLTLVRVQAKKLRFQASTMPKLVELRFFSVHMTTVPDGLLDPAIPRDAEAGHNGKGVAQGDSRTAREQRYQGHHRKQVARSNS